MEPGTGRVWCNTTFESVLVYVDEEDASPFQVFRDLLGACPKFSCHAPEDVLQIVLLRVTQGMLLLRDEDVGVYTLSPVRADGYSWDPEANRLAIQIHAVHGSLIDGALRGLAVPLLHAEIGRRYFRSVLGPSVERELEAKLDGWRLLDPAEAEAGISAAIPEALQHLTEDFPAEGTHDAIRDGVLAGREAGEIYREVCRRLRIDRTRPAKRLGA